MPREVSAEVLERVWASAVERKPRNETSVEPNTKYWPRRPYVGHDARARLGFANGRNVTMSKWKNRATVEAVQL